jgi:plasmid stability protein
MAGPAISPGPGWHALRSEGSGSRRSHSGDASSMLPSALSSSAMATLHLRNVPDEVDAALAAAASTSGISKNRRAIEALRRGLGLDQLERSRLIEDIRRARRPVDADVAELIRKARPAGSA